MSEGLTRPDGAVADAAAPLMSRDDVVRVDGVRLPIRHIRPADWAAEGSDRLPTLVFLHEGLGSIGLWKDVPEVLVRATGLPALVYERQGHGAADPLTAWPRPVDYLAIEAEHVLPRVLTAAGVERYIHIGHSDGGSVALLHAALGPGGLLGAITLAAHVFVESETLEGIRAARHAFVHGALRQRLMRWHGRNTDSVFWAWNTTWLAPPFAAWDMTDRLPAIRCPLLVVQGDRDPYGTPAQVDAICSGTGGPAGALMVPDCGHSAHLEARATVLPAMAAAVRDWVGAQTSRASIRAAVPYPGR